MKNPQDQRFFASGYVVVRNALANGHILTREQRQYCIHAIDQHEALVEFCRRVASFGFSFDPRDQANGAYRDAVRGIVQDAAALLAEEKP